MQGQVFTLAIGAILILGSLQLVLCQQATTNAKLLVDKEIHNKYIVEGRDILVNYHLINIGGSVARDVKVIDDTFPTERFELINGFLKFTIPAVAPGTNVTHAAVVRPRANSWGPHRFGPAQVEYKLNDAGQLQLATTSELGEAYVVASRTFDKKFSSQIFDWTVFILLCLPSLAGPYYLWNKSDSRFKNLAQKQASAKKLT
uniref:Translocon-associated protein subunit beta n=1 Tax=Aceria tosichella TaxID=561515 RepID=A0A6G1SH99_9ACAR